VIRSYSRSQTVVESKFCHPERGFAADQPQSLVNSTASTSAAMLQLIWLRKHSRAPDFNRFDSLLAHMRVSAFRFPLSALSWRAL